MSGFLKKNRRRLLTGYGVLLIMASALGVSFLVAHSSDLLRILASSLSSFGGATTTMYFRSYGEKVLPEDSTTSIDVNINTKVPVNALGVTISFPKETIEVLGINKENSFFDLWTEDTSISLESGEIHFSGGTTRIGGVMGTGTVITLRVRARSPGDAELRFKSVQVYPSDGSGDPVSTITHPISYRIEAKAPEGVISSGGASINNASIHINPDLNGDGSINLIDLSIMTVKMLSSYDSRYDLNINGTVGLDDLSVLMTKL